MNAALISFTEKGRILSKKLASLLININCVRWCFEKHSDDQATTFQSISDDFSEIFEINQLIIFICAAGIAVRTISPYLQAKQTDPAVIVIDDCAKFVIPILSGHIGKANAFAKMIAETIEATAVITTATDIGNIFSPDSFAIANNLVITDLKIAKEIAAVALQGQKIGLSCNYPTINIPNEIELNRALPFGISINHNLHDNPFSTTLHLPPKNIVIGVGCKRNTELSVFEDSIKSTLQKRNISFSSITDICSINIKDSERCILEFSDKHNIKFTTYTSEQLKQLQGTFHSSSFVEAITGVDNICERSAMLCSGGTLILPKTVYNGVTIAIAEKPITIDFERKLPLC